MRDFFAGSDGAAAGGALKVERGARAALRGFGADLAAVLRHPVFASAVAGITLYTGGLAVLSTLLGGFFAHTHPACLDTHCTTQLCVSLGVMLLGMPSTVRLAGLHHVWRALGAGQRQTLCHGSTLGTKATWMESM